MEPLQQLSDLTNKLFEYTLYISNKYEEVRASGVKGDFYAEVKPFADEVKIINDKWKMAATEWILNSRPKNIHVNQIDSAHEQIETLSIQAFFPETSRTRFINYLQSVQYVLKVIISEIEQ